MKFSSIINNHSLGFAVDTSVVVNLQACTYGKQIVAAVPNQMIVAQIAADELKPGTDERNFLDDLVESNLIQLANLTEPEYELYEELIKVLDDGESATIAMSINRRLFPFIDEKKGRAHATALQAMLEPGWSIDLLRHPNVVTALVTPTDTDAVYLALKHGRMRIPKERTNEVITLIGMERAAECFSLPGYKQLFPPKTQSQLGDGTVK